ncbi:MAG: gliding motility-associated C-terminal domain-containing protein, partial [Draconibacterium sp.]|nr:gliding motility-associated C-terminal domain-containing protein [Draconibacterium sp.]
SLSGNSFEITIDIFDNKGSPLDSIYFPVRIKFTVNGTSRSQSVSFNDQTLQIPDDWFNADQMADSKVSVIMLSAIDRNNATIPLNTNRNTHIRTIFASPQLQFVTQTTDVYKGTSVEHVIELITGNSTNASYFWNVTPAEGTSTDLESIEKDSANILWDGPLGSYSLEVYSIDGNGCLSDTIIQQIKIIEPAGIIVDAGRDTTIGICNNYTLQASVDKQPGTTYSYLWSPTENLDDPTKLNPVFTPGSTTLFTLTVTNNHGVSAVDSVKITVDEIIANAGDDVVMYDGETTILDGTASIGETLQYLWTTSSGTIDSGENTANPVVSGFGSYYLEITDKFGCADTDTVMVSRLTHAPVAVDDYDTTAYLTEVKIAVLDNDIDPDNNIDSLSLKIMQPPFNGTAYVDYNDFTIHYTPNKAFSGNDIFRYQICDSFDNCDEADVYVFVTEYEFLIPNAFSPNGDGINDYFEIIGIEKYEGNSISIFNRWGNEVYKAVNYGISTTPQFWDGKSNTGFMFGNEELPTGTYYYVLNLGNGVAPIGGSIYLDR